MLTVKKNLLLLISACILTGCAPSSAPPNYWDLSAEQRDSVDFVRHHHYSINYNFLVTADSLTLQPLLPQEAEIYAAEARPVTLHANDKIVVAATACTVDDSTQAKTWYIKVAHDQETMGWTEEQQLLRNVVPDDPVSQFIHTFSNNYIFGFCIILAMLLLFCIYRLKKHQHIPFVHFQDIDSAYPPLLCVVTALTAMVYGIMRTYTPGVWEAYYYDPSLNPIGQPPLLAVFLTCAWLILILFVSTLDEVMRRLGPSDALAYLLGLGSVWFIIYVVFSQTVGIYLAYPMFLAYLLLAWHCYRRHHVAPYLCGQCGRPLRALGRCPRCGAINT